MKKIILFAALLFSGFSVANAQAQTPAKTSTELSVTLMPIQTITINQASVELIYKTRENYNLGVTNTQNDHFKVYSTGGFAVSVNSAKDVLDGVGSEGKTIDSNTISVKASSGDNAKPLLSPQSVQLSQTGKTLFSSVTGGADLSYNVEYAGANLNKYFDKLFNGSSNSVFKTTVTYTISPL